MHSVKETGAPICLSPRNSISLNIVVAWCRGKGWKHEATLTISSMSLLSRIVSSPPSLSAYCAADPETGLKKADKWTDFCAVKIWNSPEDLTTGHLCFSMLKGKSLQWVQHCQIVPRDSPWLYISCMKEAKQTTATVSSWVSGGGGLSCVCVWMRRIPGYERWVTHGAFERGYYKKAPHDNVPTIVLQPWVKD